MKIPETQEPREKIPVLKPDWKDHMAFKNRPQKFYSFTSNETACSLNQKDKVPSGIISPTSQEKPQKDEILDDEQNAII